MKTGLTGLAFFSCLTGLLLLAACDSVVDPLTDDEIPLESGLPCFETPPGKTDYFPLAIGNTWTYDYWLYSRITNSESRESGEVSWTIAEIACSEDDAQYRIREQYRGVREVWNWYLQDWEPTNTIGSRFITLTEDALGNISIPYGPGTFSRYHDTATQDSLNVTVGRLTNVFSMGAYSCANYEGRAILSVETGMVDLRDSCHRLSSASELTLELTSFTPGSDE